MSSQAPQRRPSALVDHAAARRATVRPPSVVLTASGDSRRGSSPFQVPASQSLARGSPASASQSGTSGSGSQPRVNASGTPTHSLGSLRALATSPPEPSPAAAAPARPLSLVAASPKRSLSRPARQLHAAGLPGLPATSPGVLAGSPQGDSPLPGSYLAAHGVLGASSGSNAPATPFSWSSGTPSLSRREPAPILGHRVTLSRSARVPGAIPLDGSTSSLGRGNSRLVAPGSSPGGAAAGPHLASSAQRAAPMAGRAVFELPPEAHADRIDTGGPHRFSVPAGFSPARRMTTAAAMTSASSSGSAAPLSSSFAPVAMSIPRSFKPATAGVSAAVVSRPLQSIASLKEPAAEPPQPPRAAAANIPPLTTVKAVRERMLERPRADDTPSFATSPTQSLQILLLRGGALAPNLVSSALGHIITLWQGAPAAPDVRVPSDAAGAGPLVIGGSVASLAPPPSSGGPQVKGDLVSAELFYRYQATVIDALASPSTRIVSAESVAVVLLYVCHVGDAVLLQRLLQKRATVPPGGFPVEPLPASVPGTPAAGTAPSAPLKSPFLGLASATPPVTSTPAPGAKIPHIRIISSSMATAGDTSPFSGLGTSLNSSAGSAAANAGSPGTLQRNDSAGSTAPAPATNNRRIDLNCKDDAGRTPLMFAAMRGHERVCELLLDAGAIVYLQDKAGRTALHWAAAYGQSGTVRLLARQGDALLAAQDHQGNTPLHCAVFADTTDSLGVLLRMLRGDKIESANADGLSPLTVAVALGKREHVNLLLDHGACLDGRDRQGRSVLHWAASQTAQPQLVRLLVSLTPKLLLERDSLGRTALLVSAAHANDAALAILLEASTFGGSDRRKNDGHGASRGFALARLWRALRRRPSRMRGLKKSSSSANATAENAPAPDTAGHTVLHWAAVSGSVLCVRLVLLHLGRAAIDAQDAAGATALHYAAQGNLVDVLHVLLLHGAHPMLADGSRRTPVFWAAMQGQLAALQQLLFSPVINVTTLEFEGFAGGDSDAFVEAILAWRDDTGGTLLHAAAQAGHTHVCAFLVQSGASPLAIDNQLHTALFRAAAAGSLDDVVAFLLEETDVARRALSEQRLVIERELATATTLLAASQGAEGEPALRNYADELNDRLQRIGPAGAERAVDDVDADGRTMLHWAASAGHASTTALLLRHGASSATADARGTRPLHEAAYHGHGAIVELLLASGAIVDQRDDMGCTPLHWAAAGAHLDVCKILVAVGARCNATDYGDRDTPLDYAQLTENNAAVVEYLYSVGGLTLVEYQNRAACIIQRAVRRLLIARRRRRARIRKLAG